MSRPLLGRDGILHAASEGPDGLARCLNSQDFSDYPTP